MIFSEFLNNPLTKRYYEIIENAKLFPIPSGTYTEKHHIIPRCFYKAGWVIGNTNDPTNLVILTGREHFICHQLLTQMLPDGPSYYKMSHAFFGMCRISPNQPGRYIPSPEEYESARILSAIATSKLHTGKLVSLETRARMSIASSKKYHSDETKLKLSELNLGKKYTEETKAKLSISSSGRRHTEETKRNYLNRGLLK